jgi:hypothetical protein
MEAGKRGPAGDTGPKGDTGRRGARSGKLVGIAALCGVAAVAVFSTVTLIQGDEIEGNRGAIERSCEILNEAIVASTGGESHVLQAFSEEVFDTPAKVRKLVRAQKKDAANPTLPPIDCERVADDPHYHPFADKP